MCLSLFKSRASLVARLTEQEKELEYLRQLKEFHEKVVASHKILNVRLDQRNEQIEQLKLANQTLVETYSAMMTASMVNQAQDKVLLDKLGTAR